MFMTKIKLANTSSCTGCHACSNICPSTSIKMVYNRYGFLQPYINAETCIKCHLCEKICPIITPFVENCEKPIVISSILKDEAVRQKSTSGGAFFAFASYIISRGGIVFGASFDGYHVRHSFTECIEGLYAFMGSKYVQSEIGQSFKIVERFLQEGRKVLFSGTPCQVAGLNHYLKKTYSNLITIELLCRGVPSPKVWEKYISDKLLELHGTDIKDIRFRTKSSKYTSPIISYILKFTYLDDKNRRLEFWEDCVKNPYYSYFLHHYFRASCYQCKYRNASSSKADLTIGDAITDTCFGAETDNKVSTIVIHTNRGKDIFNSITPQIEYVTNDVSILEKNYRVSTINAQRDKLTKAWRVVGVLAQRYTLEKIRKIYEYTPYSLRGFLFIKRKVKEVFC